MRSVERTGHFSGFSGVIALALMVIPVVLSTTENMLRLGSDSLREAAFALGAPKHAVIMRVALKSLDGRRDHGHPAGRGPDFR